MGFPEKETGVLTCEPKATTGRKSGGTRRKRTPLPDLLGTWELANQRQFWALLRSTMSQTPWTTLKKWPVTVSFPKCWDERGKLEGMRHPTCGLQRRVFPPKRSSMQPTCLFLAGRTEMGKENGVETHLKEDVQTQ